MATLLDALDDAAHAGYTVAGFSGGEPLLYSGLASLLKRASALGMITTVTSNGMLIRREILERLDGTLDLLAISLDGIPTSHDAMRGSGAFLRMKRRLEEIRQTEIAFGFVFTLTRTNIDELPWVARFAREAGARLLQVHPLESAGRAIGIPSETHPDDVALATAFVEIARLRDELGAGMWIQLDAADADVLRDDRRLVFAEPDTWSLEYVPFAELVSPLVIESDGMVVPVRHGFDRRFAVGSLGERSLSQLMSEWRVGGLAAFRRLCRDTCDRVTQPRELPFLNWHETLAADAGRVQGLPS